MEEILELDMVELDMLVDGVLLASKQLIGHINKYFKMVAVKEYSYHHN
jgi:hypothetical protein